MPELLSDEGIGKALGELPEWQLAGTALERTVELASFPAAIQAVTRIAEIAENNNHHPDIDIRWRTLKFSCSTHSEGGITERDVTLAKEIDRVLTELSE